MTEIREEPDFHFLNEDRPKGMILFKRLVAVIPEPDQSV